MAARSTMLQCQAEGVSDGRRLQRQQRDKELAAQSLVREQRFDSWPPLYGQGNDFLFPKHCLLTGSNTGSSGQGSNAM